MNKPSLVILAAGMASRYGAMKQTEGFGPNGETIMDYSVYDAIRAGFGKVVFIIREEFAAPFRSAVEEKLAGKIEIEYAYQDLSRFVKAEDIPGSRTKPWGTGHAMLCAEEYLNGPFAVINADDFYGRDAFEKAADFLNNRCDESNYALIGYPLKNTLSEFGTVSRGVCEVNDKSQLATITERTKIFKEGDAIVFEDGEAKNELPAGTNVSMNFWCFPKDVFGIAKKLFADFPKNNFDNIKAEFFIPVIAEHFIRNEGGTIHVIPTESKWFGVTYKEDAEGVRSSLVELVSAGEYPEVLNA